MQTLEDQQYLIDKIQDNAVDTQWDEQDADADDEYYDDMEEL